MKLAWQSQFTWVERVATAYNHVDAEYDFVLLGHDYRGRQVNHVVTVARETVEANWVDGHTAVLVDAVLMGALEAREEWHPWHRMTACLGVP